MKNKELFDRTIAVLVKAYQRGDLNAFNCAACAVGNLVAAGMNYSIIKNYHGSPLGFRDRQTHDLIEAASWRTSLYYQKNDGSELCELGRRQLYSTGYTDIELIAIETVFMDTCKCESRKLADTENSSYHFENNEHIIVPNSFYRDERVQYAGLMAVVDVLMEIHEATAEQTREAKEQFVKA